MLPPKRPDPENAQHPILRVGNRFSDILRAAEAERSRRRRSAELEAERLAREAIAIAQRLGVDR